MSYYDVQTLCGNSIQMNLFSGLRVRIGQKRNYYRHPVCLFVCHYSSTFVKC